MTLTRATSKIVKLICRAREIGSLLLYLYFSIVSVFNCFLLKKEEGETISFPCPFIIREIEMNFSVGSIRMGLCYAFQ